jgi:hypothetical protein
MFKLFGLVMFVLWAVSAWRMHEKAGQPGWVGIIPGVNVLGRLKMIGKPYWWGLLYFVPVLHIVVHIVVSVSVARSFGKSALFGLFLAFVPLEPFTLPFIGLTDVRYLGPDR